MTLKEIFYYISNAHVLFPWWGALLIYLGIVLLAIITILLLRLLIYGFEIKERKEHFKSSVLSILHYIDNNLDYLENINDNIEDLVYKFDILLKEKSDNCEVTKNEE